MFGTWAIVTGSSSGIGKEFARQLASEGMNVVLVARREHLLNQLGAQLKREFDVDYRVIPLDMTDENFIDVLEASTADLDVGLVICNAGTPVPGQFLTIDRDTMLKGIQLKIVGQMSLVHHFGQRLVKRGKGGGLLMVSSTGALQGIPYVANNAAMEAYILSLGEALHSELKSAGVTVTVLLPGPTDTPALQAMGFTPDELPMKPMTPEQCVSEGLAALKAGRTYHIPGRMNRWMARLLPRAWAVRFNGQMIGKTFAGSKS